MAAQEMWSSRELERQFRLGAFERAVARGQAARVLRPERARASQRQAHEQLAEADEEVVEEGIEEMKATEAKRLNFLQKSPQFVIPIYQRTYSWSDKQCRQLWDDILRAGSSDAIAVRPLRILEEISADILAIEKEAEGLLRDVIGRQVT